MGVDDLYFLGYRDSGMAGTTENQNPTAYANADAAAVVPRLVRFIRTIRPQVVITFDPTGGYGHPDHIAIHKHTVAAFHAAADASYAPQLGEPWQAQRLLYPTFPQEMFIKLRDQLIAQGIEPPDWGTGSETDENGKNEESAAATPIHVAIDIHTVAPLKLQALKSHRTQFGPNHPFRQVPEEFILQMLGTEYFEQALPEIKPQEPYTDLFEGLVE
jgi:LmbE family N-acetylglucosaminyl deacetylase